MDNRQRHSLYAGIGLLMLLLLASLACNLTKKQSGGGNQITSSTPPTVSIINPPSNATVNQAITIEVESIDPLGQGVTNVELRVNGRPVDSKASPELNGTTPFHVNLSWTPPRAGSLTVSVVAWRRNVPSAEESFTLLVGTTAIPTSTPGTGSNTSVTPSAPNQGPCRARVDTQGLRFRSVPDTSSSDTILDSFALNEEPLILGRLADNSWYQVQDTTSPQVGWVSAGYVTVLGVCTNVPVVSRPATPTVAPTNTAAPSAAPALADLVALPISGRVSVQLDSDGEALELYSLSIQNIGGSDSGAFQVQIVLPGGQEIVRQISNLAAGQILNVADAAQQSVVFTSPGTQQISLHVDYLNAVNESNEANNIQQLVINVEAQP